MDPLEAIRQLIGAIKLIIEDDTSCEFLKTRQLDENVTIYDCVVGALTEVNDSGVGNI